jgi:hypothetical protein
MRTYLRHWGRWPLIVVAAAAFTWINLTLPERNQAQEKGKTADPATAQDAPRLKGWKQGTGFGWIWGKEDEVGALNALTSDSVLFAASEAGQGL